MWKRVTNHRAERRPFRATAVVLVSFSLGLGFDVDAVVVVVGVRGGRGVRGGGGGKGLCGGRGLGGRKKVVLVAVRGGVLISPVKI